MSFVRIIEKTDRVITAPHCISFFPCQLLRPVYVHVCTNDLPSLRRQVWDVHPSTEWTHPTTESALLLLLLLSPGTAPHFKVRTLIDLFSVSLHKLDDGHLPAVRAVQGGCMWLLKYGRSPWKPTMFCGWDNPILYLDQSITKRWCKAFGCHASYWVNQQFYCHHLAVSTTGSRGHWKSHMCIVPSLKSPATQLFSQQVTPTNNKEKQSSTLLVL